MRKLVIVLLAVLAICGVAFAGTWDEDLKAWQALGVSVKYGPAGQSFAENWNDRPSIVQGAAFIEIISADMKADPKVIDLAKVYLGTAYVRLFGACARAADIATMTAAYPVFIDRMNALAQDSYIVYVRAYCVSYYSNVNGIGKGQDTKIIDGEVAWLKTQLPSSVAGEWRNLVVIPLSGRIELAKFIATSCTNDAVAVKPVVATLIAGAQSGAIAKAELKTLLQNVVTESWARVKLDDTLTDSEKTKLKEAIGVIKSILVELP